jgi:deoxycytidylate deaminase
MQLAFTIANRSPDPKTKCGSIITDNRGRIIGSGYNGMPRDTDEEAFPWERGEGQEDPLSKYPYVHHAEKNAILNCVVTPHYIGGAICYVNGKCCFRCLNDLWQFGIHTVYQGNVLPRMVDDNHKKIIDRIISKTGINIINVDCSIYNWYEDIMRQQNEYFRQENSL